MTRAITNIATIIIIIIIIITTTTADATAAVGDGLASAPHCGDDRFAPRLAALATQGKVFLERPGWLRSCG